MLKYILHLPLKLLCFLLDGLIIFCMITENLVSPILEHLLNRCSLAKEAPDEE